MVPNYVLLLAEMRDATAHRATISWRRQTFQAGSKIEVNDWPHHVLIVAAETRQA